MSQRREKEKREADRYLVVAKLVSGVIADALCLVAVSSRRSHLLVLACSILLLILAWLFRKDDFKSAAIEDLKHGEYFCVSHAQVLVYLGLVDPKHRS